MLFLAFALATSPVEYNAEALAAIAIAKAKRDRTHIAAVEVAAKTFRTGSYHSGHQCPNCGTSQYVIASGVKGGNHTHICPSCRTAWNH